MKVLFCNVAYLNYYDGRIAGEEKPNSGGRWVLENGDAHEKWNFLNMDGRCYGYVQGNSDSMHIERLEGTSRRDEVAEDVLVVWCACHPKKENGTVVVGWYEHATVYRDVQQMPATPISGLERDYWIKTKAENAYLLPTEFRTFKVGRAAQSGRGTGFGKQNYWFADSEYAKETLIPALMEFIESHRGYRMNQLNDAFECPEPCLPLSEEELALYDSMDNEQWLERLPLAYRWFQMSPSADAAYDVAFCLKNCFQYEKSLAWYEKVLDYDRTDDNTREELAYLYQQCQQYEKSIACAKELMRSEQAKSNQDYRDELYCILADNYYFSGNKKEARKWQMRILEESKNQDLIDHTKCVMEGWA